MIRLLGDHFPAVKRWGQDSAPMTQREFYVDFTIVLIAITVGLIGIAVLFAQAHDRLADVHRLAVQNHRLAVRQATLSRERVAKRQAIDKRICRKVDRLDKALIQIVSGTMTPKPGVYGYAYWKAHHLTEPKGAPGKPPRAAVSALREAACDPTNLPG